ncbi:hypothetical protein HanXRQr2_Chr10g0430861 [Helianthus annuus]|uniref:Uncharacterized protein n=1 Tax=Helianthus annuus TaxID=4232 RepID=A0A9K3HWG4_HELAN|nr:hypothetical protein HanXRQr2_Chr10g0430861 [Helianthus annuus]KAJ0882972.1 hypothetical protein HanPSC8_Chr10g0415851 [Helianthus annuus]
MFQNCKPYISFTTVPYTSILSAPLLYVFKGELSDVRRRRFQFGGWFKDAHQLFDKMLQLKFQDANYQPVSFCHGHHLEIKCSS